MEFSRDKKDDGKDINPSYSDSVSGLKFNFDVQKDCVEKTVTIQIWHCFLLKFLIIINL